MQSLVGVERWGYLIAGRLWDEARSVCVGGIMVGYRPAMILFPKFLLLYEYWVVVIFGGIFRDRDDSGCLSKSVPTKVCRRIF